MRTVARSFAKRLIFYLEGPVSGVPDVECPVGARRECTAGSTGERNTLSFHKKMERVQWFIERGSAARMPRKPGIIQ
jgi:hypothetical protein